MDFTAIAGDVGFTEGPAVTPAGAVAFVSLDHGVVYVAGDGGCRVLARTGGGPNGLAVAADGTLYVAQNGGRWATRPRPTFTGGVQAVSPSGDVRWLTQDPIAPNDLCFGPDGLLYVTDPTRRPEMDDGRLWRIDTETGDADLFASVGWYPNGIGFAADDALYVARSGEGQIVRYAAPGEAPEVFCEVDGMPDGFAWDAEGNLVVGTAGAPGTVCVYDADGRLADTIAPGSSTHYTNLAISTDGVLYVTDAGEERLLRAPWPSPGLALHPFRVVDRSTMRD